MWWILTYGNAGETNTFCRGYISFITYLLQGEFICRGSFSFHIKGCHHQKGGECWSLQSWTILMMDKWWWTSIYDYSTSLEASWSLWELLDILCNIRILWKALKTYTKYPFKSTWPSNIVDYPIYSRLAKNPSRLDTSKTIDQVSVCCLSGKLVDLPHCIVD